MAGSSSRCPTLGPQGGAHGLVRMGRLRGDDDAHARVLPRNGRTRGTVQGRVLLVPPSGLVVNVDYTAWGWTHIVLGLLVAAGRLRSLRRGHVGARGRGPGSAAQRPREPRVPVGLPGVVDDHDRRGHPGDLRRDCARPGRVRRLRIS